ncbi:MAG TPA: hypothetical protein VHT27_13730 [Solirubrobacteraceae bacterium]|nr:hypothetical protein [Solirubrobacteraceae bacterium]
MAGAPTEKAEHGTERARERSPRELARTGAMLALAVLATLFAVLNLNEVKVDWIIGSGRAPLIVVIVISVLAGIVLTYLAERIHRKRR